MTEPHDTRPPARVGDEIPEVDRRRLVDGGPFGYVACTVQGAILRANETLHRWLGADAAGLGRTFQELLVPGDRIYFDTHIRPLLHMGGSVRDIAVELVCRNGDRVPVLLTASLVEPDDAERFIELLLVDATVRRTYERELVRERERAERATERLQLLYDLMAGFAAATTIDDVQRVVTASTSSPFKGVQCHMWLFSADMRTMVHASPDEVDTTTEEFLVEGRRVGSAFDELSRGQLVEVVDPDAVADRYPIITGWLASAGLRCAILAPLLDGDTLIGTLGFGFTRVHEFEDDERRAVQSLAGQTSHALRRTRLHEAQVRSRQLLERLYVFGRSLGAAVTVDEVIAALTAAGHDHFDALDVRVGRLVRNGSLVLAGGRTDAPSPRVVQPSGASDIAIAAVAFGDVVVARSRAELTALYPTSVSLSDPDVEHVMAVPLEDGEQVVGAWVLGFDRQMTSEDDQTVLRLFADEAAQAIRRASMHELEADVRRRAVIRQGMSEALNRAATIDAVAEALVVEGRNAFDADGLAVLVVDGDQAVTVRQIGLPPDAIAAKAFPLDDSDIARLLASSAPMFAEGTAAVANLLGRLPLGRWRSAAALPLGLGSGSAVGLIVVLFRTDEHLDVAARRALAGIAAEASVALGRARQFDIEHTIAVTLQQSLLSERLPAIEGWRIDPWYSPSNEFLMVGGDLFDVLQLADGNVLVVVGDVVGHGLEAASSLGQLRSAARALALDQSRPAELIARLDRFARSSTGVRGATLCCAIIEPSGSGRYACAGHPYPILVSHGTAELLTDGRSALLGYGEGPRDDAEFRIVEGGSLIFYTDGVVERPDTSIDDGIERLRLLTETVDFASARPAETIGTTMLPAGDHRDDAVVLTVTHAA